MRFQIGLAAAAIVGCGSFVGVCMAFGDFPEQKSAKPRVEAARVDAAEMKKFVDGLNTFGVGLMDAARPNEGNFAVSPYSVTGAFGMLYGGARGATERELTTVLHYDPSGQRAHEFLNAQEAQLRKAVADSRERDSKATLNVNNAVWVQNGFQLAPQYLDILAQYYGAGVPNIDFTKPVAAAERINGWISQKTEKRIPKLLDAGDITPGTRLILTNTVYFLARWASVFDAKNTKAGPFHLSNGTTADVPLMSQTHEFQQAAVEDCTAVALDYAGGKLSMLVMMPDESKLATFEKGLDAAKVNRVVEALKWQRVALKVPKFTFSAHASLANALKTMGMTSAFSINADFSGIGAGGEPLFVNDVIHEVFVKVDEEGTEAAAATAIVMRTGARAQEPINVTIDRPFYFAVRDNETGLLLFIGRVMDPR